MAKFPLLTDLPVTDQLEYARISKLASTARTTKDAAFLSARSAYDSTEVISTDSAGLILEAAGKVTPTAGWTGFKKGAKYVNKADASGSTHGTYLNTGDETSAAWQKVTSA